MTLLNIVNTGDINILRERVRILKETVRIANKEIYILKKHRTREMMDANIFATMSRSLAKELNLTKQGLRDLRAKARKVCEEDLKQRGVNNVLEHPPSFFLDVE